MACLRQLNLNYCQFCSRAASWVFSRSIQINQNSIRGPTWQDLSPRAWFKLLSDTSSKFRLDLRRWSSAVPPKGSFIKKSGELDLLLLFSSIILHYWKSIEFERSRHFCAFLCDFLRRTFNFIIKWPIHFQNGGIVIDPSNCFFCHKSSLGNGKVFQNKGILCLNWKKDDYRNVFVVS